MKITEYINAKITNQVHTQNYHIGKALGISSAMLSHYKTGRTEQPSLELAKRIYELDSVVIWPYSVEAVAEGESDVQESRPEEE